MTERLKLPLMPLRDLLVFPSTVVPLFVGRDKSINALEQAMSDSKLIVLAGQTVAKTPSPTPGEIYTVGTIAKILQLMRLPDGTTKVLVEGQSRCRILGYLKEDDHFLVEVETLTEKEATGRNGDSLKRMVKDSFDNYVRLNKRVPPEMLLSVDKIEKSSVLADTLVSHLTNLKFPEKQELLEELNVATRLEKVYTFIESEIEIMRVERKIRARVKKQIDKSQKEYYLNEQMNAIQKELGDKDDPRTEVADLERQIKAKKLSEEAKTKLLKEARKLKSMPSISAEATVIRNYIDTVLSLPWGETTDERNDVKHAREVLDADHFGLDKVKDRILEYLSVRELAPDTKGPILCLVGPPGVGKTSLAKSVAEATGRKFVRISLGGVRDEAEIRGHRRTYIGAMPGKIINAIKKAGSVNPVVLLDEIDKLSQDFRGDPTSALLEVLDPEQNNTFNDHYLDLDFDLSKVLFMATSNSLQTISRPLLDRMEVITLSSYTEEEKLNIAQQYLVGKQLKANGLKTSKVEVASSALQEIIRYYTREAGVRNLEREIGSVLRKCARKHLEKTKKGPITETINDKSVTKYLGARRYRIGLASQEDEIGICTGLAYTSVGGDLLPIEVNILPGKGKLTITGKLGDVMQESVQAAFSYVKSKAEFFGLDTDFYKKDIHIHVPDGATPKDGPSAGLAIATALTSALSGRKISREVAMTGEISLRGKAMPIGGLKEKLIAAHRGGIKKAIIPRENEKDLEDVPKSVLKDLKVVVVDNMQMVLLEALVWEKGDDLKAKLAGKP